MLTINGKDYELRYPMNTLCSMCDAGIDVMRLTELKINIKVVRELFMYGLKYENKKITQAQAGDLMDAYCEEGGDIKGLSEEIMTCLAKALGGKVEDNEDDEDDEDDEDNTEGEEGK